MATTEPFSFIEKTAKDGPHHLFDDFVRLSSAKSADHDTQYISALREANPGMIVTCVPMSNVSLLTFAAAGFAQYKLDRETDSFASWRGYVPPAVRSEPGGLGEAVSFAKYHYKWNNEDFILYTVNGLYQYVLKECRKGEHPLGPSKAVDELIKSIGDWMMSILDVVWVYDGYWRQDKQLYQQVMKSSWDNVILDEDMKQDLTSVANKFFSSKHVYEELGVPWKRGLMFHGPPGNGKTISIRALMHELYTRKENGKDAPIPSLYVKDAPLTYDIGAVFSQARRMAPCMLILEDVETIVTPDTRSYFFNEMDGLENNDGLFVVASTNFLDKLDPGLTKRPSRFDRKYKFPLPNEHERTLYCEFWRQKLKSNKSIEFPSKLCQPMAHITPGFSFAFLQECFVATLLVLARDGEGESFSKVEARPFDDDNDDLDDYEIWVAFKKQANILRKEIEDSDDSAKLSQLQAWCKGKEHQRDDVGPSSQQSRFAKRHCSCCDGGEDPRQSLSRNLRGLNMKGSKLPELPWMDRKQEYINSAAFELR